MNGCHSTAIAKVRAGESCRYVFVTAAHCFDSPVAVQPPAERQPVTVERIEIMGTYVNGDQPNIVIEKHPDWNIARLPDESLRDWNKRKVDIAVFSFTGVCDDAVEAIPIRSTGPRDDEFCAIKSDHTERYGTDQRDGRFRWVPRPLVTVNVVGEWEHSGVRGAPTRFNFTGRPGPQPAALVPGDSGSGMLCPNADNQLELTGVLIMAPHFGAIYAVQAEAAMAWARTTMERLVSP